MRLVHAIVASLYLVSVSYFGLLFLPSLLDNHDTGGMYIVSVAACQIPVTIVAAVIYLLAWGVRGTLRGHRTSV